MVTMRNQERFLFNINSGKKYIKNGAVSLSYISLKICIDK